MTLEERQRQAIQTLWRHEIRELNELQLRRLRQDLVFVTERGEPARASMLDAQFGEERVSEVYPVDLPTPRGPKRKGVEVEVHSTDTVYLKVPRILTLEEDNGRVHHHWLPSFVSCIY